MHNYANWLHYEITKEMLLKKNLFLWISLFSTSFIFHLDCFLWIKSWNKFSWL